MYEWSTDRRRKLPGFTYHTFRQGDERSYSFARIFVAGYARHMGAINVLTDFDEYRPGFSIFTPEEIRADFSSYLKQDKEEEVVRREREQNPPEALARLKHQIEDLEAKRAKKGQLSGEEQQLLLQLTLDSIDEKLEENAERFVRGYRPGAHLKDKLGWEGYRGFSGPFWQSVADAAYTAPGSASISVTSVLTDGPPASRTEVLARLNEWYLSLAGLDHLAVHELPDESDSAPVPSAGE
jgi:hypothetical protein